MDVLIVVLIIVLLIICFSLVEDNRLLRDKYYKHIVDDENSSQKMAADMVSLYADYKRLYVFVHDPNSIDTRVALPDCLPPSDHFVSFKDAVKTVYNKKNKDNATK